MKSITVENRCQDFNSFRAAYVKSLFNVESGADFKLQADLPIDASDWKIGVIVGPSGSGKTSIGGQCWGSGYLWQPSWSDNKPIIDEIAPAGSVSDVTASLSAVGLGSVPTWLRPYSALSNGERFRADLARLISEAPDRAVVDEFSSVVDRQIAKVGAGAFAKSWRKTGGQAILLSCHYDILEWVKPDWVFDTSTGEVSRGCLRRPELELSIYQTDWRFWPAFEKHHYLKLPKMIAATNYIGVINGQPVAHIAFSTRPGLVEARASRLVILPEWQGAGVGLSFLNSICELWKQGCNRYEKPMPTLFHTSHPGLCNALRLNPNWTQVSASLYGGNKANSFKTMNTGSGHGGHFRAIQGFRYLGRE